MKAKIEAGLALLLIAAGTYVSPAVGFGTFAALYATYVALDTWHVACARKADRSSATTLAELQRLIAESRQSQEVAAARTKEVLVAILGEMQQAKSLRGYSQQEAPQRIRI